MTILQINDLALELVRRDFDFSRNGGNPTNGGPTKTSRALAIIHLAAHDAYAKVTGLLTPRLENLPNVPQGIGNNDAAGTSALLGAGIHAAEQLYPNDIAYITERSAQLLAGQNPAAVTYGRQIGDAWIDARNSDGSGRPQLDTMFNDLPGCHRPDPRDPGQQALGRSWGKVTPFVLQSVVSDAPLDPPPSLTSQEYAESFDDVLVNGRNDIITRDPQKALIGIFWGYDGANKLGTPPRLYNQVVRAALALDEFKNIPHSQQIKVLTAINVAQADAGIAAWYWKYAYDFWRPIVGIREAEAGFGPTGKGDGNTCRKKGDPFWLPLGGPRSNPFPNPVFGGLGANPTPNFPAYPSGHATFGAAAFETAAALLGSTPESIVVSFVSDEFNGETTDNVGTARPRLVKKFSLREAIEQNNISRIYLGVHWDFDASGGELVGKAVADKVVAAFQ